MGAALRHATQIKQSDIFETEMIDAITPPAIEICATWYTITALFENIVVTLHNIITHAVYPNLDCSRMN